MSAVRLAMVRIAGFSLKNGRTRAPGGAAGAEHQHAFARHSIAEVAPDVVDKPDAVEVFGIGALALEFHGVDRAGKARAFAQVRRIGEGVELEGGRHVEPAPALAPEGVDARRETPERSLDGDIGHGLPGLSSESRMDERRFGVDDRIADDGVEVDHFGRSGMETGVRERRHRLDLIRCKPEFGLPG